MNKKFSLVFIWIGLIALGLGAFFGVLSSLVYLVPDFVKEYIGFNQLRPLHITTVISWIILTATGGIYYYLTYEEKLNLYSWKLGRIHLVIFCITGIGIYLSFFTSNMGGREYLTYHPMLTIPILLGWVLFGINYFKTLIPNVKNWPVYYWMWGVGIVFMIYHLSEAHFWVLDYFRENFIRDITVQWKSYGSFVGSWNMLVYGTAIYVMSKIKNDENVARGKKSFFFFFLGLTNLMFGWAHHTYIIPTLPWVRYVAYVISMTEWIIFISMIYNWSKSLPIKTKLEHSLAYKFLINADIWVFINLFLALLMSIPSLNYFTHGTHITVAHSMGTTIGINTSILFASVSFVLSRLGQKNMFKKKSIKYGYYIFNGSLLIFWISLIFVGIYKGYWMYSAGIKSFGKLQAGSNVYYIGFVCAGIFLFTGLLLLIIPMVRILYKYLLLRKE